jgi:hypothetical protein
VLGATIATELEIDRQYQQLTNRILTLAAARAKAADVRGVQRLTAEIEARNRELGAKRPDSITALLASLDAQLEAARSLRLARDRWELRRAEYAAYGSRMAGPLARLDRLKVHLEDIKALAGSSPFALSAVQQGAGQATKALSAIVPPEEFRAAHALFLSAAQLADTAANIRLEAALTRDLRRAWDASSAAAGALLLDAQARNDYRSLLRLPQLPQ